MKLTVSCVAKIVLFVIIGNTLDKRRPIFDEGASECTRDMAKSHNQCLAKSVNNTYLETYNCEYIKSPKPERFARAMVRFGMLRYACNITFSARHQCCIALLLVVMMTWA